MASKIRKDDDVVVLAGKDAGRKGKVLRVVDGGNRVIVEKANMVKRHTRPSQAHPQGGIIDQEASLHISNVALVSPTTGQPFRAKIKTIEDEDGKSVKVRYNPKTGETVE